MEKGNGGEPEALGSLRQERGQAPSGHGCQALHHQLPAACLRLPVLQTLTCPLPPVPFL